jgi:16S rRNA (adenine1518-N6/adenine1519-N6)-dimethyltransferase
VKHIPRKRFGQHFLTDTALIERIVEAIDPKPSEALVEIGPGLGAMTHPVLARSGALTVVELDRDLARLHRQNPALTVIENDVLKVDWAGIHAGFDALKLRVIGNLPYNISSPILFALLPHAGRVLDQHFMLQREVIERMVAQPATSDYGRLSVMLQWRYAMENLFDVPPEAFDPPPRVWSAIVRMTPLASPAALDAVRLSALVQAAFSQRRKLLRHSLGPWLDAQGFSGVFDLKRRAEEVPVDQYIALCQALPEI